MYKTLGFNQKTSFFCKSFFRSIGSFPPIEPKRLPYNHEKKTTTQINHVQFFTCTSFVLSYPSVFLDVAMKIKDTWIHPYEPKIIHLLKRRKRDWPRTQINTITLSKDIYGERSRKPINTCGLKTPFLGRLALQSGRIFIVTHRVSMQTSHHPSQQKRKTQSQRFEEPRRKAHTEQETFAFAIDVCNA